MEFTRAQEIKLQRVKDKEETKRKLIIAVGEIIRTKGYTGLGVNKIAKQAGYHKKLIYRYFGTPDNLIETYVLEKDYWMVFSEKLRNQAAEEKGDLLEMVSSILENQYVFFMQEEEMQQIIFWELSGKSDLMRSISNVREDLGEQFLALTDEHFKNSTINFRALSAILSAGIYYMILHAKVDKYCGIDINDPADSEEVKRTLRQIITMAFEKVKSKS